MNIDFKKTIKTEMAFFQLPYGAIFTAGNEYNFYMRIDPMSQNRDGDIVDLGDSNAVNLGDGKIVSFGTDTEVVLLNDKLTVWY